MATKWNAWTAVGRRPRYGEHAGLGWRDAARRVVALSAAARETGISKHVAEHVEHLSMCLVMMPDEA